MAGTLDSATVSKCAWDNLLVPSTEKGTTTTLRQLRPPEKRKKATLRRGAQPPPSVRVNRGDCPLAACKFFRRVPTESSFCKAVVPEKNVPEVSCEGRCQMILIQSILRFSGTQGGPVNTLSMRRTYAAMNSGVCPSCGAPPRQLTANAPCSIVSQTPL